MEAGLLPSAKLCRVPKLAFGPITESATRPLLNLGRNGPLWDLVKGGGIKVPILFTTHFWPPPRYLSRPSCSLAFYVPWKWAALGFTGAGNVQAAVAIGNPLEGHYPHSHHYLSLALPAALMITRISARASADSPGHASVTIARAASISEFAPSAPHFAPPGF